MLYVDGLPKRYWMWKRSGEKACYKEFQERTQSVICWKDKNVIEERYGELECEPEFELLEKACKKPATSKSVLEDERKDSTYDAR